MNTKIIFSILIVFMFCSGCGLFGGEDKEEIFKNPVYANVYFEKTHPNGAPIQGLIVINYDNPKEFKLLSSDTAAFLNIRISPDNNMISYSDKYITGLGSTP